MKKVFSFLIFIYSFSLYAQDTLFRYTTNTGDRGDMPILTEINKKLNITDTVIFAQNGDIADIQSKLNAKVNGTGTTNTLAMFTGTNTIGNSPLSNSGSLLTSTSRLIVPYGSASNYSLTFPNQDRGLYYDGRGIGFSMLGGNSKMTFGYTQNYGSSTGLRLEGSYPKIEMLGDATSYPTITFSGSFGVSGGEYASIEGNGGLLFKTSATTQSGFLKSGATSTSDVLKYVFFKNDLNENQTHIGSHVGFDPRYNNFSFRSMSHKRTLAQNDYTGGLLFGSYMTGLGDAVFGNIMMQYTGTNEADANQRKFDITFNTQTTKTGTYQYEFSERMRIKDNGNIVYNGVLQQENPSTAYTVADAGRYPSYNAVSGTVQWSLPNFWGLTGNSGTNTSTNFIGTTDNQSLSFRTNNVLRQRLTVTGRTEVFGVGDNTFVGENSANESVTGIANSGFGERTLTGITDGTYNSAMGYQSLYGCSSCDFVSAYGVNAGRTITTAQNGVIVGYDKGNTTVTSASDFVVIGAGAGSGAGANNQITVIGADATATAVNATAIGYGASNSTANSVRLGNSSVTRVDLGGGSVKLTGLATSGATGSDALSVTQADNSYEKKTLSGSVNITQTMTNGATYSTTITVTGAAVGDVCVYEFQSADVLINFATKAMVTSANTVTVYLGNASGVTQTFTNVPFKVRVFK